MICWGGKGIRAREEGEPGTLRKGSVKGERGGSCIPPVGLVRGIAAHPFLERYVGLLR